MNAQEDTSESPDEGESASTKDVHAPVNLGNTNEFTISELVDVIQEAAFRVVRVVGLEQGIIHSCFSLPVRAWVGRDPLNECFGLLCLLIQDSPDLCDFARGLVPRERDSFDWVRRL